MRRSPRRSSCSRARRRSRRRCGGSSAAFERDLDVIAHDIHGQSHPRRSELLQVVAAVAVALAARVAVALAGPPLYRCRSGAARAPTDPAGLGEAAEAAGRDSFRTIIATEATITIAPTNTVAVTSSESTSQP